METLDLDRPHGAKLLAGMLLIYRMKNRSLNIGV